jgi:hypothetical protein
MSNQEDTSREKPDHKPMNTSQPNNNASNNETYLQDTTIYSTSNINRNDLDEILRKLNEIFNSENNTGKLQKLSSEIEISKTSLISNLRNIIEKSKDQLGISPEIAKKIDATDKQAKKIAAFVENFKSQGVIAKPGTSITISFFISVFIILACLIAIFIKLLDTTKKDDLQNIKLASATQAPNEYKIDYNNINSTLSSNLNQIKHEITNIKTSINENDLNQISSKLINAYIDHEKKRQNFSSIDQSIIDIKTKIENIYNEKEGEIKRYKEIEKEASENKRKLTDAENEIKDLKKPKEKLNKSLLIVFAASSDLHLSDKIANALTKYFENEQLSINSGFHRAFFTLVESTLTKIIEFDKPDKKLTIQKNLANEQAVNLNKPGILEVIKKEAEALQKKDKEVLVILSSQGSPPDPDDEKTAVFKDKNITVNFIIAVKQGSNIGKSIYDKWVKWGSNNNATITWIYDNKNNTSDDQILSIIHRAMRKDMGF